MECNRCGKTGDVELFTKTNVSKDGKKSMCKECKKKVDNDRRVRIKQEQSELKYFDLTTNLLIRGGDPCECPKCGYHWQK